MTTPTHIINLGQDWSNYHIPEQPEQFELLTAKPDTPDEGGAILLPSANIKKEVIDNHLKNADLKGLLHTAVHANEPIPHFLGALHFEQSLQNVIQHIEIPTIEREDELHEEEHIVLTVHDGQAESLEDLNLKLQVFENDPKLSGLNSEGAELVETYAIFLDEDGKKLHKQRLTEDDTHELENSVKFQVLGSSGAEQTGKKFRGIIKKGKKVVQKIKKIIIIVKKVFGKIKRIVEKVKARPVEEIVKALRTVKELVTGNPYRILSYNFTKKEFQEIDASELAPDKKTLILLHGTIKGSFDGRIGKKRKKKNSGSFKFLHNFQIKERGKQYKNWFDYLNQKSENTYIQYEQILSLEHETVLDSPQDNVDYFIEKWNLRFNKPVSIICASRGSLVAKCMAAHTKLTQRMTIDRTAIVSGGYSGYFDKDKGVEAYVEVHKCFLPPLAHAFLKSIVHTIVNLPGFEVQCKENNSFKAFTEADLVPASSKNVIYYNMTNNHQAKNPKFLDKEAKRFLGDINDLALAMEAQRDFRPGVNHADFPPFLGEEKHGDGLRLLKPKQELFAFLTRQLDKQEDGELV